VQSENRKVGGSTPPLATSSYLDKQSSKVIFDDLCPTDCPIPLLS